MAQVSSTLTVIFDDPFWVGIFERQSDNKYEVFKITFGAEPKDYEVYDFILKFYSRIKFSKSITSTNDDEKYVNPKRMQRLINKQLPQKWVGTKAQQALKLQQEQTKTERKVYSREQREADKLRKFELKQEKRKEKHRGH